MYLFNILYDDESDDDVPSLGLDFRREQSANNNKKKKIKIPCHVCVTSKHKKSVKMWENTIRIYYRYDLFINNSTETREQNVKSSDALLLLLMPLYHFDSVFFIN